MKILVFDTETTGLPSSWSASVLSTNKWPYIVQLSYILYDTDSNIVLNYSDQIIKLPDNIIISKESENIHKISNEISKTKGVDIKRELVEFNMIILEADVIVAHNISFDKNMIMVEFVRNKLRQNFTRNNVKSTEYCTMKNSVDICKIEVASRNGTTYYKYPKLMELYKFYFNSIPNNLHNSMVDVLACLRCYGKMKLGVDFNELSLNLRSLNVLYNE